MREAVLLQKDMDDPILEAAIARLSDEKWAALCSGGMPAVSQSFHMTSDKALGGVQRSAQDVHSLFLRFCVKGDGFCQDYAKLAALLLLEHVTRSPLGAPVDEGSPTRPDRSLVCLLRSKEVEWMQSQRNEWERPGTDGKTECVHPSVYMPSEGYEDGSYTGLNRNQYGDLNTLAAASAVLGIDVVSLDETGLGQSNIQFFSGGKGRLQSATSIYDRVQRGEPLIAVFWNGSVGTSGHYAAGVYQDESGNPIRPPSWSPPAWLWPSPTMTEL